MRSFHRVSFKAAQILTFKIQAQLPDDVVSGPVKLEDYLKANPGIRP
jgi:hypothetical protein